MMRIETSLNRRKVDRLEKAPPTYLRRQWQNFGTSHQCLFNAGNYGLKVSLKDFDGVYYQAVYDHFAVSLFLWYKQPRLIALQVGAGDDYLHIIGTRLQCWPLNTWRLNDISQWEEVQCKVKHLIHTEGLPPCFTEQPIMIFSWYVADHNPPYDSFILFFFKFRLSLF